MCANGELRMSQALVDNLIECPVCGDRFWVAQPEPMYDYGYDALWRVPQHTKSGLPCIGAGNQGVVRDTRSHRPSS